MFSDQITNIKFKNKLILVNNKRLQIYIFQCHYRMEKYKYLQFQIKQF